MKVIIWPILTYKPFLETQERPAINSSSNQQNHQIISRITNINIYIYIYIFIYLFNHRCFHCDMLFPFFQAWSLLLPLPARVPSGRGESCEIAGGWDAAVPWRKISGLPAVPGRFPLWFLCSCNVGKAMSFFQPYVDGWNPTHKYGKHGDSLLLFLVIWSYIWGGRTSINPSYLKIHPIARVLTHSHFMMQEMPTRRLSLITFWWSKSQSHSKSQIQKPEENRPWREAFAI